MSACEYKPDKRGSLGVETVSEAVACEINMISEASMFIYWKCLDRMQSRPAAAASGVRARVTPACPSLPASRAGWQNRQTPWWRPLFFS